MRISIGGTLSLAGVFGVPAGAPDPRTVSPATGEVVYQLLGTGAPGAGLGPQVGVLVVKMLDDERLLIEDFDDRTGSTAALSPNARVYVR